MLVGPQRVLSQRCRSTPNSTRAASLHEKCRAPNLMPPLESNQRKETLCFRDNLLGLNVGRDRNMVIRSHCVCVGTPRKRRGADGRPHQTPADRPQKSTDDGPTCSQAGSRRRQWPSLRSATRRCKRRHTAARSYCHWKWYMAY